MFKSQNEVEVSPFIVDIINGTAVPDTKYPFLVFLEMFGSMFCGGSIFNEWTIITAAHCISSSPDLNKLTNVVAGVVDRRNFSVSRQERRVKMAIIHPDYDRKTDSNDIAVLFLEEGLKFNENVDRVCLPWTGFEARHPIVAGWGKTENGSSSEVLLEASVPIFPHDQCVNNYAKHNVIITDQMMCAGFEEGGIDTCEGDSGGPLFSAMYGNDDSTNTTDCNFVLVGITSFGIGCAVPGYPGIYTKVIEYVDWIQNNTYQPWNIGASF